MSHPILQRFATLAGHSFGEAIAITALRAVHGFKVDGRMRAKVLFNPRELSVHQVRLKPNSPDLTLAHEFGHVLHCSLWPLETMLALQHQAERLALWCEARLCALNNPADLATWRSDRLHKLATVKGVPGPYRVAAQWLRANLDDEWFRPLHGIEPTGDPAAIKERMKRVFTCG